MKLSKEVWGLIVTQVVAFVLHIVTETDLVPVEWQSTAGFGVEMLRTIALAVIGVQYVTKRVEINVRTQIDSLRMQMASEYDALMRK